MIETIYVTRYIDVTKLRLYVAGVLFGDGIGLVGHTFMPEIVYD